MYGLKHSAAAKQKISQKAKDRPKIACRVCNMLVSKSNYIRWHGDKCKSKT